MKSDWHKTSPVQERLELSQFAIEEKQSYSNFQEILVPSTLNYRLLVFVPHF